MTAERALALWHLLIDAGLDAWVDGGWGVDALVGAQTREHGDLDLGIVRPDLDAAIELLGTLGYVVTDDRYRQVTVQLTHAEGHRVDLHPSTPVYGGGTEQSDFDGATFHIPPPVTGRIGGQTVRCMPPEIHLRTHSGYELRQQDLHDLALLQTLGQPDHHC
jgi:lincosamide nucleotidyltransferase A/C/D/E